MSTQLQAVIATLLQLSTEAQDELNESLGNIEIALSGGKKYKFIAASQTNSILETSVGSVGDLLESIIIIPTSASPGAVSIKDGAGTAMQIFAGSGANPLVMRLSIKSAVGAWQVTTGTAVTVLATGEFS